jgi:hypothetical protein
MYHSIEYDANETSEILHKTGNMYINLENPDESLLKKRERSSNDDTKYEGLSTADTIKKKKSIKNVKPSLVTSDSTKTTFDQIGSEQVVSDHIESEQVESEQVGSEKELNIEGFFICPVCDFVENIKKMGQKCDFCDLLNEMADEAIKIKKLRLIIQSEKTFEKKSKNEFEILIIHIATLFNQNSTIYPRYISDLFMDILNNNFLSFNEYFRQNSIKNDINFKLSIGSKYHFIFLDLLILYYLKKGWGWNVSNFPKDFITKKKYVLDRKNLLNYEYDKKIEVIKDELYMLENWICK